MRNINISTDVYALIWASRAQGEESEDDILRRLLKVGPAEASPPRSNGASAGGVIDARSGVHFAEGFRIFRRYKGRDFAAVASGGQWRREDNGVLYPSINRLNGSIVAGVENVWNGNWRFQDVDGQTKSIAALRRS